MSDKLLVRITQAAQIYGIQDRQKDADLLREARSEILRLQVENKKLKGMIDEGLGWEDMQQDSMQSHIN